MTFGYTIKKIDENMAKAVGLDLPISFKQSIEICNYIRGDSVAKAKKKLEDAISGKKPIPFRKYTNEKKNKKGNLLAGRYPIKACTNILKLLKSAESNAVFKGLNSKGLVILHLSVKSAPGAWHYGRQRRRRMKRSHVEVILKEVSFDKASKSSDKSINKPTSKPASESTVQSENKLSDTKKSEKTEENKPLKSNESKMKSEEKSEDKPEAKVLVQEKSEEQALKKVQSNQESEQKKQINKENHQDKISDSDNEKEKKQASENKNSDAKEQK
ncbi:MAG: 50S ribosomal protein L22 [Candidatus Woesearchaeota archaeon]